MYFVYLSITKYNIPVAMWISK